MDIVTYGALQKKIKEGSGELNIPTNVSAFVNDVGYQTEQQIQAYIASGIVTSLTASASHGQCPSAKAVYDTLGGLHFAVSESAPTVDDSSLITFVVGG